MTRYARLQPSAQFLGKRRPAGPTKLLRRTPKKRKTASAIPSVALESHRRGCFIIILLFLILQNNGRRNHSVGKSCRFLEQSPCYQFVLDYGERLGHLIAARQQPPHGVKINAVAQFCKLVSAEEHVMGAQDSF